MRKVGSYLLKENELSRNVFFFGMTGITVALWFLLKKFILGYYFWQDEIRDGVILHYIYIGVGSLNAWFVSEWCRNKSLFRMIMAGLTPLATVMSLRWFFQGFVTAKFCCCLWLFALFIYYFK